MPRVLDPERELCVSLSTLCYVSLSVESAYSALHSIWTSGWARVRHLRFLPEPARCACGYLMSLADFVLFLPECRSQLLGLDVCIDTPVGNNLVKGISGGQKKRVTTGRCGGRVEERAEAEWSQIALTRTLVGSEQVKGISGGQKKRVTTGAGLSSV